jgi:hypothetical protein
MHSRLVPYIPCPTDIIHDWFLSPLLQVKCSGVSEEEGSLKFLLSHLYSSGDLPWRAPSKRCRNNILNISN